MLIHPLQHRPDGHLAVRGEPAEEQEESGPADLEGDGAQDGRHRGRRGDDQRADRRHGRRRPPQAGGRLLQPGTPFSAAVVMICACYLM